MRGDFDDRIVPPSVRAVLRSCQARADCRLGGGAALAGCYLHHRYSADADLFFDQAESHRALVASLPAVASDSGSRIQVVRDAGGFVRARVETADAALELDLVHDPVARLQPSPAPVDGVVIESLDDLRANKLTCLLSRFEPRDLVDLLFLDRAGYPPEDDLPLAARKDGGVDPGVLAWLLGQFPAAPLPRMIAPLTETDLTNFRDQLRERFRQIAVPG